MKYILAHDLGTSGNKATLFDQTGKMVANYTESYKTNFFNGNWAEQDSCEWWKAVCLSSRKVLERINPSELGAVVLSGQMMACLCVDEKGTPLRKAIIYCDQRAELQTEKLISRIGFKEFYKITGHRPSSTYSLEKLMWIYDNEPEIYNKTFKLLQAKDYINYRMTGRFVTDYNDASGTNAFDLASLSWSEKIIEASGINPDLFPEPVSSTTVIGEITESAYNETGIPKGTPVVAGAGDGGCATIGAGSFSEGMPYCYMGSSSWVSVTTSEPVEDVEMKIFTWAHPVKGLYQPCGTMQTAGSAINWISSILFDNNEASDLEVLNMMAAEVSPGSDGVFFLPYLLGERSPWWDPNAKGCFIGLNLNTEKKNLCRAAIEGIAMNLNESLKIMLKNTSVESVTFIGGGANGKALCSIFADVFGARIDIPKLLSEATSMGAAVIGGVGTGIYNGFEIVEKMNPVVDSIILDKKNQEFYIKHTEIFRELYINLKDSFQKISDFY